MRFGNTTTNYTWDYTAFPMGRLTSAQEGSKTSTTLAYFEPSGLVQSVSAPTPGTVGTGARVTTSYTYDSLGNVLTVVAPGNNAASAITTTLNYTTDGTYSQNAALDQPISVTNNLGKVTHLRYDARGNLVTAVDALGIETDATYNLADQPLTVVYPATGQSGTGRSYQQAVYQYTNGSLVGVNAYNESNALWRQVVYGYGPEGETLSRTGSAEPVTLVYDANYRLKYLKDGKNNQTTYNYNTAGYCNNLGYPGGDSLNITLFDGIGRAMQRVDGRGITTNYLYNDAEGALTDIQYPAYTSLNVHFTFDGFGRRATMTDGSGSQSYAYDDLDALSSNTTTYTGLPAKTISYSFYNDGSRSAMSTPAGGFSYGYDAIGRMTNLTNPYSEVSNWTYLDNDWLWTQTLGNGAKSTYTYNSKGLTTDLTNTKSNGTLLSQFTSMVYDGVGNRTSMTSSLPAWTAFGGLTTYSYDSKDQLTQEASARAGGYTNNFAYDAAGNPTTFKGTVQSFNSNNQNTAYTFDLNGNPTTYKGNTLSFDVENRMTAYGSVLTAGYRGDSLRAWKQSAAGRTYFLYDGHIACVELDTAGNATATNSYGSHGLVSRKSGSTSYYQFDTQGSVAQRLDSAQNILSSLMFDAFGVGGTSGGADCFGYGAEWSYVTDVETGLQSLSYRNYDPGTGRFEHRDPILYAGGINLYAYVKNSPFRWIDPNGLGTFSISFGGMGQAAFGATCDVNLQFDTNGHVGIGFDLGGLWGPGFGFSIGPGIGWGRGNISTGLGGGEIYGGFIGVGGGASLQCMVPPGSAGIGGISDIIGTSGGARIGPTEGGGLYGGIQLSGTYDLGSWRDWISRIRDGIGRLRKWIW